MFFIHEVNVDLETDKIIVGNEFYDLGLLKEIKAKNVGLKTNNCLVSIMKFYGVWRVVGFNKNSKI